MVSYSSSDESGWSGDEGRSRYEGGNHRMMKWVIRRWWQVDEWMTCVRSSDEQDDGMMIWLMMWWRTSSPDDWRLDHLCVFFVVWWSMVASYLILFLLDDYICNTDFIVDCLLLVYQTDRLNSQLNWLQRDKSFKRWCKNTVVFELTVVLCEGNLIRRPSRWS